MSQGCLLNEWGVEKISETVGSRKLTQSEKLEKALQRFLESSAFNRAGIGALRRCRRVKIFERPYSLQAIYHLEGAEGTCNVYVKIFKNWRGKPEDQFTREIEMEYQTICFWYEQLKDNEEATTFRPLFFSPEYHCIITEETPGKNLAVWIQEKARYRPSPRVLTMLEDYLYKCGRLLGDFQSKTRQSTHYAYEALIEDVDIRLKQLVRLPRSGLTEMDRGQILGFYRKHLSLAKQKPFREVYLHRDFGLGNILIAGRVVVVHDFNRLEKGHPYFDFTRLYHQLEMLLYKPIYNPRVIRTLQDAYFNGYGFRAGRDDLVFNFFLLRHYFTHLLGLVRGKESSLVSRLYSTWVRFNHKRRIKEIIQKAYS